VPYIQTDVLKQAVFNTCAVRPCSPECAKHQKQAAIKHSVKISKPTKSNDNSLLAYISALLASALHVLLGLFGDCIQKQRTVTAFVLTPVIILVTAFKLFIDFIPLILFVLPFAVWIFG
jgi:ABC-type methionine transport system permease subunit